LFAPLQDVRDMSAVDFKVIPDSVTALCQSLQHRGFDAFLVGGGVRDLLLGRPISDWDVATSAKPQEVERTFRRTIPTGIKHGTVTVLIDADVSVEVTTFRGEGAYSDGRRPDAVRFVSDLDSDLQRRDFTINAMALDPVAQCVVDPLDGGRDLAQGVVRAVGRAAERFAEDGLRPMRAVRFAAVLGFDIAPETFAAIEPALPTFRRVSAERVRDELLKILVCDRPSVGLDLMRRSGLLDEVLPQLVGCIGLSQNRYHTDDVYTHSLRVCDATPNDAVLRLAGLLHDVGKPLVAKPRPDSPEENAFHGHEVEGQRLVLEIAARLKLSGAQRDKVAHLVRHHMVDVSLKGGPALRRLVRRVGTDALGALLDLRRADLGVRPQAAQAIEQLDRLVARLNEVVSEAPALEVNHLAISGRDVMQHLGCSPGPQVGTILRALVERVIEQPELNRRDRLLAIVDGMRHLESP